MSDEAIHGQHPQKIIIEEIREATIADFFDFRDLMSVMKEAMAAKIGNDDALTDEAIAKMAAEDDGYIAAALEDVAANIGLRIDGFVVVNRWVVDRWWLRDEGDAEV